MKNCPNCGTAIADDELIIWKCQECGKKYKIKMSKICNIKAQKDKTENVKKSGLKCRECGADMVTGNEKLFFRCKECGEKIKGNLDYFTSDTDIEDDYVDDEEYTYSDNLICCPDCGKKISNKAKNCPRCGCPVGKITKKNRQKKKSKSGIIILIIVLIITVIAGVAGWYFITADSRMQKSDEEKRQDGLEEVNTVNDMQWTVSYDGMEYVGSYTGEVKSNIPNGKGTFSSDKDSVKFVYEGLWENGNMSGTGHLDADNYTIHLPDFDKVGSYSGDIMNGIPEGQGSFSTVNNDNIKYEYVGEFKNGIYNGQGSMIWEDGFKNIGNFTDGKFCPSVVEGLNSRGTASFPKFTIEPETSTFIEENMQYIIGSDFTPEDVQHMINFDLSYAEYIKRPNDYLGQYICWTGYTITQVWVDDFFETGNEVVELIAMDDYGHYIYAFAIDEGESKLGDVIYEGTHLDVLGIPIATSHFENTDGGTTNCVVLLISFANHY